MLATSLATLISIKSQAAALWLFQSATTRMNLLELWGHMGWPARAIAIILLVMSAWSIGVMLDRWMAFTAARKQSRQFAPLVAGALREGKLDEAIRVGERNKKAIWPRSLLRGCRNFARIRCLTRSPATRLKPASELWTGQKPSSTPNLSAA